MKKSSKKEIRKEEYHSPYHGLFFKVKKVHFNEKSPFQKIEVIENDFFGKILIIDNLVQTTEKDEFFYHEMLIHPAFTTHPSPQKILIIGGGDGGALREVLRYQVKEVVLIEIDEKVIEASRKFFPNLSHSFKDKRVKVIIANAAEYIKKLREKFDIVIVDSSDPVGPSKALFQKEFFSSLKKIVKKDGIIIAQTGSPLYHKKIIKELNKFLKKIYKIVKFYISPVPTYPSGIWSFVYLSENINPLDIKRKEPSNLKYYNKDIHLTSFTLPNFIKEILYSYRENLL
ncbi:polyamine aminopropyltransferase [Candidatus Aminicenantes bacterium AH-873-B07]|jgi:spermidine synthase|nr:polyamine aminopropyltransferase [Candidatus Aminicenantes bacterium AH-873-B07]